MLAYAASRPTPVERRPHPNTMLAIIALHVGVAAIVMSAKMDLPGRLIPQRPTTVLSFPKPKPQDPLTQPQKQQAQQAVHDPITKVEQTVVTPVRSDEAADPGPSTTIGTGTIGGGAATVVIPTPVHDIVKRGPTLLTSGDDLKPPYPASKLLTEEEASLQLRLTINDQGRVIAVDPVGRADPVFLAAARRHLLAKWRFRPATEDGHGVTSTEVITLRFELDG